MKKHCMYLPERMVTQLKEIATERELSVSELIRRYLDEKIAGNKPKTEEELANDALSEMLE